MKKAFRFAAVLLAAAAVHLSAAAAPIVDQNNPTFGGGFCYTSDGGSCGQSFRQDHSNISGAGFYVDPNYRGGGDGTVTLSIFGVYDGGPDQLIASGSATGANSNSGWVDVFWTPAALSAGNRYFLIIESTNRIVAAYSNAAYANGNAVFLGSTTAYASYDLTFRTYFDGVQQVPEPGSFALFAIGIAGLGFALRKKRGR